MVTDRRARWKENQKDMNTRFEAAAAQAVAYSYYLSCVTSQAYSLTITDVTTTVNTIMTYVVPQKAGTFLINCATNSFARTVPWRDR